MSGLRQAQILEETEVGVVASVLANAKSADFHLGAAWPCNLNGDLAATMSKTGGLEPSLELTVFAKATTKV